MRAFPRTEHHTPQGLRLPVTLLLVLALVLPFGGRPAGAVTTAEKAVHTLINQARADAGVRLLPLSDRLSRIARRHSKEMADRRTLFHSCLPCSIGSFRRLAENVGYGSDRVTVHDQLMASPPHRANILNPKFRRVGVGVVRRAGLVWVTQIFYA